MPAAIISSAGDFVGFIAEISFLGAPTLPAGLRSEISLWNQLVADGPILQPSLQFMR